MSLTRIFVYGTLKRGMRNHHYLDGATYEGVAMTAKPDFVMVEFNSKSSPGQHSPGIYKADKLQRPGGFILGEVYAVSAQTLAAVDQLERVGISYMREKIRLDSGLNVDTYLKVVDTRDYATTSDRIEFDAQDRTYRWMELTPAG